MGEQLPASYDDWLTTDPEDGWEECQSCFCLKDVGPDGLCDKCAKEDAKIEDGERKRKGED